MTRNSPEQLRQSVDRDSVGSKDFGCLGRYLLMMREEQYLGVTSNAIEHRETGCGALIIEMNEEIIEKQWQRTATFDELLKSGDA